MAWRMTGKIVEACSCKMVCRCTLGPAEPDMGWCSAGQLMLIERGNSDGVDLSGTKAALALQLPGDFLGGVELARLYIDEATSSDQRRELEAIFTGQKGGVWGGLRDAIARWLPTQVASIEIEAGEKPSFRVGRIAEGRLERLKTEQGRQATLENAPVAAAFGVETLELARSDGARWEDPDLRHWQAGGFGAVEAFDWSG